MSKKGSHTVLSEDGHRKPNKKLNRLASESSTYLQQHACNPVDWYPWSSEALAAAKEQDKPILLSIGYAACHWCHVMAHESFEDDQTAQIMNRYFINIKVDREERTDLDEIYMKAVQMMTGHGGWPMTVFLTPDLLPFFGGTYFPPSDRHGLPGFSRLLVALAKVWQEQREDIKSNAEEVTNQLLAMDNLSSESGSDKGMLDRETVEIALEQLLKNMDSQWGGFGSAPKFPHSFSLNLAMRYIKNGSKKDLQESCVKLVRTSLDRMAEGGIQDQLGGGFARYSTDRKWLVPHFEKMLYDNALLALTYLDGFLLFGKEYWKRVAEQIFQFVLNDLITEDGAFYSSLDADSEGEEGRFYVWHEAELKEALSPEEFQFLKESFAVEALGNFEHSTNILHLSKPLDQLCADFGLEQSQFWQKIDHIRQILLKLRDQRVHPGLDEKVLTGWNSLMITAFVAGYRVCGNEAYLNAAKTAAKFILEHMISSDGKILRTWGKGKAKLYGYLDDYSYFTEALLELASVDDSPCWFENAVQFSDQIIERFYDDQANTLWYTSLEHEKLITRPKSIYDGAVPSGMSVAISCFLKVAKLTNQNKYLNLAEKLLLKYASLARKYPDQFSNLLCAMDFHLANGPSILCLLWLSF